MCPFLCLVTAKTQGKHRCNILREHLGSRLRSSLPFVSWNSVGISVIMSSFAFSSASFSQLFQKDWKASLSLKNHLVYMLNILHGLSTPCLPSIQHSPLVSVRYSSTVSSFSPDYVFIEMWFLSYIQHKCGIFLNIKLFKLIYF